MRKPAFGLWAVVVITFISMGCLYSAERKETRVLFDFEDGAELEALKAHAENAVFDIVQDNGVTSGKNCCRVVGTAGTSWASFEIRGEPAKNWGNFDYFAMDLFLEREEKLAFSFELWDAASKNYHTRCTFGAETHVGRNTLIWRINRAKRNGKEGLDWNEAKPEDKISMNGLSKVKLFFTPFKEGGNTVVWIDRLRLLQEDAVGGKLQVTLPEGAKAFDFGPKGTAVAGFTHIGAGGPGVSGTGVKEDGKAWPDPLTGDGLESESGAFRFEFDAPDGEYWVWISAGKVLDEKTRALPFQLKVGDQTLCDEKLSEAEFYGEKGLFRFLRTQYSNRPNALWLDYVEPVCPERAVKAKAEGGKLAVQVCNHRLAALVALPAKDEEAFKKLAQELREQRIKTFYNALFFDPLKPPAKRDGDGAYVLWAPSFARTIRPDSGPAEKERAAKALDLKAARGQRVVARVCVSAFEDLGTGELEVSDLTGPGTIPAASVRKYYQNYRVAGTGVDELALLPWAKIRFEPGLTWAYWLWLQAPEDAKPGSYKGTLTFKPEKGGAKSLPVSLEVYPFKLDDNLPVSYGMYCGAWQYPPGFDRRKLTLEQHRFMREMGLTATCVGTGSVKALKGEGKLDVTFDPLMYEIAKESGMGRNPDQMMMGNSLGMARQIARLLGLRPAVDHNPGIEFTKPELKGYYQDAIRQYKDFIAKMGLPVAVETVDEPREVPNPWNRNLEHTNTYGDWIKEVGGLKSFVTPMGDKQSNKDYTSLVDHHDIISVHAYAASKALIEKTQAAQKTLWFYNTGKDRLSWGFYSWRMGSKGRWEWHWYFGGSCKEEGYPAPNDYFSYLFGAEGIVRPAPYAAFTGGLVFESACLNIAEGVNDYAYLVALERALEAVGADAGKARKAEEARAFLAALKQSIPIFPGIKNMSSPNAGALVGAGLETPVAEMCEAWRDKVAEFLIALKN